MGEILNIYQYQSVDFTSTTTGATPLTLSWNFPGGSPTAGTGPTRKVFYNVPGNYSVTLTATDTFGTTNFLTETNIIRVDPVTITPGISGPTPSTVKMDEGYNLYDNSAGNPYPAISWYWQLPYGITASTQNVGVTGYVDWYTLTGAYSGSPGSTYIGDISLTVNNGYTPATATSTIEIQKLGPSESLGLNATGAFGTFSTQTGLTGGILINPPGIGASPATLQDLGYPGTGSTAYAFHVDLSTRTGSPSSSRLNQYFHSTNEQAIVSIGTGFYSPDYISSPVGELMGGFLIVNPYTYNSYSNVPVDNAIGLGEYLIQNQSYDFFLGDLNVNTGSPGILSEVYNNRNYNTSLINYLITNPYKLVFSGNLQYVNSSAVTPLTYVNTGSGSNNPVVYSPVYLGSIGATGPFSVYQVYITVNFLSGPSIGATASFGSPGSTGNDPLTNGNFYVAQNNSNGPGFVSILNSAINSSGILGGTGTIVFESQEFFNCDYTSPTGGNNNPTNYHGVALKILNKTIVQSVSLADNSLDLSSGTPPPPFPIAPFVADTGNSQGSTETCSGIFNISLGSPPPYGPLTIFPPQNNYLSMGGSIAY